MPDTAEEPAASTSRAADGFSGTWWGLGGLVAGLLLALGWTRARSARAEVPASEQVDLGVGGPAGEPRVAGSAVEERLARGRP